MNNSSRIAVYHNLPSGGGKRALYEWVRRLSRHHSLDVYSLSTANHEFCDIRPFSQEHFVYRYTPAKLYKTPFGRLNQLQRWRDLIRITNLNQKIASQINRGNYDLAFINTCSFSSIPSIIQFLDIPSIFYLHEPYGHGYIRSFNRPYLNTNSIRKSVDRIDPLIKLYQGKLDVVQKKNTYSATLILANSEFTRQQMKNSFQIETPVLYYGVDLDSFHPIPEVTKENFLLSVGELTPRKGFDFLIESLGLLSPDDRPALHLASNWIDPGERNYIENMAHKNGIKIKIFNNVNTQNLCNLYNRAKLCLYSPVLEPFGLVPLESMACGTPVVGVREGGFQECIIHEQNGMLVDRDATKFARTVKSLLEDDERRVVMGEQAQEHVNKNWTWEISTDKLDKLFNEYSLRVSRSRTDDQ